MRKAALVSVLGVCLGVGQLAAAKPAVADPGLVVQDLTTSLTANDLAQTIVGSGVSVSNVAFTGKETLVGVLGTSVLPENAEWRQIRVIRRDQKDPLRKSRVIVCDLWDYLAKGDVRQDIPLAPGDVIFVPQRWSVDDQFWEDWDYVKRIMSDIFFLDAFRDGLKKGGNLRN